jgi:hypothetical protein
MLQRKFLAKAASKRKKVTLVFPKAIPLGQA